MGPFGVTPSELSVGCDLVLVSSCSMLNGAMYVCRNLVDAGDARQRGQGPRVERFPSLPILCQNSRARLAGEFPTQTCAVIA
jgi:hypothetical protein